MPLTAKSWPTRRSTEMRLLLVEEDRALADELQSVLEAAGYAVDRAQDGNDVLS